jgi:hypothetical protein
VTVIGLSADLLDGMGTNTDVKVREQLGASGLYESWALSTPQRESFHRDA